MITFFILCLKINNLQTKIFFMQIYWYCFACYYIYNASFVFLWLHPLSGASVFRCTGAPLHPSTYTKASDRRRDGHRDERGAGSCSRKRGGSAKGGADLQAVTADRGTCPMGTKIARTGLSGLSEGVAGTPYIYDSMIILRLCRVRWKSIANLSRVRLSQTAVSAPR